VIALAPKKKKKKAKQERKSKAKQRKQEFEVQKRSAFFFFLSHFFPFLFFPSKGRGFEFCFSLRIVDVEMTFKQSRLISELSTTLHSRVESGESAIARAMKKRGVFVEKTNQIESRFPRILFFPRRILTEIRANSRACKRDSKALLWNSSKNSAA
jgi:hypothetical protein